MNRSIYLKKIVKYTSKLDGLIGGVINNISIVCTKKFNPVYNRDILEYNIMLNKHYNFCNFILTPYNHQYIKYYLTNSVIDDHVINQDTATLLTTNYPIYYLSDFYTTLNQEELYEESRHSSSVKEFESHKQLGFDILLDDTKGIATTALKYVINKLLDQHKTPIILCCEPILGQREKAITYKNYSKDSKERYQELLDYYNKLGLHTSNKVFIILHLFNQNEIKFNSIFIDDLKRRKEINLKFPGKMYFETRDFLIDIISTKYEIKNNIVYKENL